MLTQILKPPKILKFKPKSANLNSKTRPKTLNFSLIHPQKPTP